MPGGDTHGRSEVAPIAPALRRRETNRDTQDTKVTPLDLSFKTCKNKMRGRVVGCTTIPFTASHLAAQALPPESEPRTIDATCLGPARIMNEGSIQFASPNADFGSLPTLGVVSNCPIMLRVLSGLPSFTPAPPRLQ